MAKRRKRKPASIAGARIKEGRKAANLFQDELGKMLDPPVTGSTVSSWEIDRARPSNPAHVQQLRDFFPTDVVLAQKNGSPGDELKNRVKSSGVPKKEEEASSIIFADAFTVRSTLEGLVGAFAQVALRLPDEELTREKLLHLSGEWHSKLQHLAELAPPQASLPAE